MGGTASAIGGGKFANGAVTAAFTHLFNDEAHNNAPADNRDWLDKASDFAAGFGDTVTFGLSRALRDHVFTGFYEGTVNYDSTSYTVGQATGIAATTVVGGAGGAQAATRLAIKKGSVEFSHAIRDATLKKVGSSWLRNRFGRSVFNGNNVTSKWHYLTDPTRWPVGWRGYGMEKFSAPLMAVGRVPYVYYGATAGAYAGYGSAGWLSH